ncbi:transcriptional regulator domain-containing protein [Sphingomonas koreensis]|uniref:Transcriptional regulator-like domain-containing protein n=1 Tax=Sphingomonas koreensis TaxID=93064 RepID=A0A1L6J8G1_9SPHN|nr:DUF6499 domain-containing protein [Sphingomonas koreensis]APR52116.1 hypothetical protein BRX40_06430 [Sphingomonas koreensis]
MPLAGLPDWRDADAYAPALAGGRPAIAWEVLRRDPAYRADYVARGCGGAADDRAAAFAADWGLHFRA